MFIRIQRIKKRDFYSYPTYDQYVSREFADKEKVMKDREVASTRCPVCHMPAKRRIRWFMNNSRAYESVSLCQKHGYIKGKVRIRHTDEDAYYAIKKLKRIEEKDAEEIRENLEALTTYIDRIYVANIIGGEPFLNPELKEIVRICAENPQ